MRKRNLLIGFILAFFALGLEVTEAKSLENVIAGEHRSEQNKTRDIYRNPKETLEFFGIKSNMTSRSMALRRLVYRNSGALLERKRAVYFSLI